MSLNKSGTHFTKLILLTLMDCAFIVIALLGSAVLYSYFLRNFVNYDWMRLFVRHLVTILPYTLVSCFFFFTICGVYKNLWVYAGIGDLIRITVASVLSCFASYVYLRLAGGFWRSPSIGMMSFYLLLSFSGGVRMMPRIVQKVRSYINRRMTGQSEESVRVLMIGAGEGASLLLNELQNKSHGKRYHVVAMLDDDEKKHHHQMHGVRIMGDCRMISTVVDRLHVQEIIIAIPSADRQQLQRIIEKCSGLGCKMRLMPHVYDITKPAVSNLRDLQLDDLLGRREVRLDTEAIAKEITDKVVLVTGGGGSIGSEICRQIMTFSPKLLVVYEIYENNAADLKRDLSILFKEMAQRIVVRIGSVQDDKRLEEVFSEFSPSLVFHAAAYKHVPLMEDCPELAIQNNVFGTHSLAACAKRHGVHRFVMISTDKAVNPTNIMGASKRLAEMVVQSLNEPGKTEFVAVRFGNVLGSNGSVVPIFQRQIENGGPITVMHPDIIRYFMTIPEAARLVIQAGALAKGGEIFILDMGEPVKIVDLATTLITMAGLVPDVDIKIEYTGLRPGEKLYEELLLEEEGLQKSENDLIYITRPAKIDAQVVQDMLARLRDCIQNEGDIRALVQKELPSYKPKHV